MGRFKDFLMKENSEGYKIYHDTYSSAIDEIIKYAADNKYSLDDMQNKYDGEQIDRLISTGPRKPQPGKTNKIELNLYRYQRDHSFKLQKKVLHAQIYNRETNGNEFELNMYIN